MAQQTAAATSDTVTNWMMAGLCLAGLIAILVFMPITWVLDPESPDFSPLILIPLAVGGVGLYSAVLAVRGSIRQRRFGGATLDLTGSGKARLGQPLRGAIRTATALNPRGDYRVALQCVDTHRFRRMGSTAHDEEFVVWEQVVTVPAASIDSTRGIPFVFRLPEAADLPDETAPPPATSAFFKGGIAISIPGMRKRMLSHNTPPVSRKWRIEASAPMPGVDFKEYFTVTLA